jgi:uncharacterized protein (DUF885 family)
VERRKQYERELLARLGKIDRAKLSESDALSYELFERNLKLAVEGQRFCSECMPMTQLGGVYNELSELAQVVPRTQVQDYENFLKRLRAYPTLVDQEIAWMKKGLESGITPPKITLREVGNLIQNQLPADPTLSPIYKIVFAKFPAAIGDTDQKRLQAAAVDALQKSVFPALKKLKDFFVREYEPKARESIDMSSLPDGAAWYAHRVRVMTTTESTAEQIHEIGLSEVKRIRGEMENAMKSARAKGTLADFFTFLRTDKQFFFKTKEDLLLRYRDLAKRIDAQLPHLFGRLPRLPYGVEPIPAYSEKTAPAAYYRPGSTDGGRAGTFLANTYDLDARPRWEMEALTLHEAVPGHHLQIALAEELTDLPKFRRFGRYTAFVEGWGLYAESLGGELGLYQDPYAKFGQLTFEMWRAIRLVVDTGMHAKGWTRQQSIDFFKANTGKSEHDMVVEVDRYIVTPAQALAYKLGELKIKELRAYAVAELKDRFDVRQFHDLVLSAGPLPLATLDGRVRKWVAERKLSRN